MSNINQTYKIARSLNTQHTHKIKFIAISEIPAQRMRNTRNRSTDVLNLSNRLGTYQRRSRRYF